jgi:ribokinase
LSAAVINSASVVKFVDTQSGLLSQAALEQELENTPRMAPSLYSWSI